MSFVITIDTPRWRAHQDQVRDSIAATGATLVPVAKGNGYGVGNVRLAAEARRLGADCVAVGTVHEAPAVLAAEPELDVLILEPLTMRGVVVAEAWLALAEHPEAARVIHTVASPEAADGHRRARVTGDTTPSGPRGPDLDAPVRHDRGRGGGCDHHPRAAHHLRCHPPGGPGPAPADRHPGGAAHRVDGDAHLG